MEEPEKADDLGREQKTEERFGWDEKQIVDELPEVSLNSETELRTFLETYRLAMIQVFNESLGWNLDTDPSTRCGITSTMIIRALYEKPNVIDLQFLTVRRASFEPFYPTDPKSMFIAKEAIDKISKETGKSTEIARQTLSDLGSVAEYWNNIRRSGESVTPQDSRIKEYFDKTVGELSDTQPELIEKVWAFYEGLVSERPNFLEGVMRYVDSGWGHTVVLLGIKFPQQEIRRVVIDANSEQFGSSFDRLFMFDLGDAVKNGYTMEDQGSLQGKIDKREISGNTDRMSKVDIVSTATSESYRVKSEDVPVAQVNRMIAEEYRNIHG